MGRKRKLTEENYWDFYNLYIMENITILQTARRLGVSKDTARNFARQYDLYEKKNESLDIEDILNLTTHKKMSAWEIAELKKCDFVTLVKWMSKNGLDQRKERAGTERKDWNPYVSMQGALLTARRDFQEGEILSIGGRKHLILKVYPYHLLVGKYVGKELVYRESYRLTELYFMKCRTGETA